MSEKVENVDVIIVGAGAAGMMCAIEAGRRGRKVLILEQANKPGKKILMSGGGRCNFTNYHIHPDCYLSNNPHFCKSALSRYTQWDFIELVKKHGIPYHEKTLGQLFCDNKSQAILDMLLNECAEAGVLIELKNAIISINKINEGQFHVKTGRQEYLCESLVVASGGLSIPSMGSSPFGYKLAEQFGLKIWPTRAGLVPFTLHDEDKNKYSQLAGVSVDCQIVNNNKCFRENMLFTHRGLSGPAMLQISSYWQAGETVEIAMQPDIDLHAHLLEAKAGQQQKQLKTILTEFFAKRLIDTFVSEALAESKMASISNKDIATVANTFTNWQIKPNGTEGYRTAEVTLGGVDCNAVSSKTMQANEVSGLYFIGEVLDVTGWLGGYNFQWAWSSGWVAGQVV